MADPAASPIDPDDILRRTFTSVRRGLDPLEVQKYLLSLATDLRAATERERDLHTRLEEAEQRVNELTELAPSRLSSLVGEETARILDAANSAASEIRARSEESVARLLREAQDEATRLRQEASEELERRRAEAAEMLGEARRQVDEMLQQSKVEMEVEVEAGRQQGREMVIEAQRVRERVLRDLARRRKQLRQQIEQLQAGRERLAAAYDVVRETLDAATEELQVVVPEAKLAAEAAALRAAEEEDGSETLDVELAALEVEVAESRSEVAQDDSPQEAPEVSEVQEAPEEVEASEVDQEEGRRSTTVRVVRADLFAHLKEEAGQAQGDGDDDGDRPTGLTAQRDEVAAQLSRPLSRSLKRVLSDEQNELLDVVRRGESSHDLEELLPPPEGHVERVAAAMLSTLTDAAGAGAVFVGLEARTTSSTVQDLAAEFAAELVGPLRERLERCFNESGDDSDALVERLRACYREWRTQRVDPLADRAVLTAFNRGIVDAVPEGELVRWILDDGGAPSPDCEDDALAGALAVGEPFPTGHVAPPAHPTCRCLLVPAAMTDEAATVADSTPA